MVGKNLTKTFHREGKAKVKTQWESCGTGSEASLQLSIQMMKSLKINATEEMTSDHQ